MSIGKFSFTTIKITFNNDINIIEILLRNIKLSICDT